MDGVHHCGNVFADHEVVDAYERALHPAITNVVRDQLKQRPQRGSANIAVARQIAVREGNSHRASLEAVKAYHNPKPTRGKKIFVIKPQRTSADSVIAISKAGAPIPASVGAWKLVL